MLLLTQGIHPSLMIFLYSLGVLYRLSSWRLDKRKSSEISSSSPNCTSVIKDHTGNQWEFTHTCKQTAAINSRGRSDKPIIWCPYVPACDKSVRKDVRQEIQGWEEQWWKFRRNSEENLDCKSYLKISGLRESGVYGDSTEPHCPFLM